jgi:hypothetical protein
MRKRAFRLSVWAAYSILSQIEKSSCGAERRMVSVAAPALWLERRDRRKHARFRGVMSLIGP